MTFKTSDKIDEWVKKHREKCVSHSTAGEQFVYEFIPTSIGDIGYVCCDSCKKKKVKKAEREFCFREL